jgi:hypothetical protein
LKPIRLSSSEKRQSSAGGPTNRDGCFYVGSTRVVFEQLQQRLRAEALAAGKAAVGRRRWLRLVACRCVEHLKATVGSSSRRYFSHASATSLGTRSACSTRQIHPICRSHQSRVLDCCVLPPGSLHGSQYQVARRDRHIQWKILTAVAKFTSHEWM